MPARPTLTATRLEASYNGTSGTRVLLIIGRILGCQRQTSGDNINQRDLMEETNLCQGGSAMRWKQSKTDGHVSETARSRVKGKLVILMSSTLQMKITKKKVHLAGDTSK